MVVSKKSVEKGAKKVMDNFLKVLDKIETPEEDIGFVERASCMREQGIGFCDEEFRKRMMENAPRKRQGYIVSEKGEWI